MFDIIYPYYNDIERKEILNDVKKTFDKTIVIDRYLQAFSQESELVDLLLDVSNIPYIGCKREDSAVNVLHAPTNRDIKGTQHILNTIEKLKDEGYKVNLIIVENKKHEDAMQMYKDAHIVVDDINQGPYGLLALECMAMGKPIVGRINEHFTKYYTDLPTVNTNKDTIYKNLKHLIEHPETCEELGKLGREYVIKHHDAINIAKKLILIYESL
jgi:glycosyltransferase involved in cell wall biosynthesis